MSNTKLVAVDSGRYRVKSMLYTPGFDCYQGFESKFSFVDFKILELEELPIFIEKDDNK